MKKISYFILIIYLGVSCNNLPNQQFDSDSNDKTDSLIQSSISKNIESSISILRLIEKIDSIYKIESWVLDSFRTDTIEIFHKYNPIIETDDSSEMIEPDIVKEKYPINPLFAFSPENSTTYYKYGGFSILKYRNDSLAKAAFNIIFELFTENDDLTIYTADTIRLYFDVFSKGGCSYFYKDNMIIHKYRRCNDDYKKHEEYENELIKFLNMEEELTRGYFMRFCCSCPQRKNREFR